jgi:hypothetical protein
MQQTIILLIVIIITVCVLLSISIYYGFKKCKPFIQVYSGCPYIPNDKCKNNECLEICDKNSDLMYEQCKGNIDCVRNAYEFKSKCYKDCLKKWIEEK